MSIGRKAFGFLLAIALLVTQVGLALADDGIPPSSISVQVPMTLDCKGLSGSALVYAQEHKLCDFGKGVTTQGGVSPDNVVPGNCGTSWLFLQDLGAGIAGFNMSATSTLGPIVNATYNTSWVNWSTLRTGNVTGSDWPFSTTWSRFGVDSTGAGDVTAVMSGGVTLVWGGYCTFNFPSDGRRIT
jgi:hypothetical protein